MATIRQFLGRFSAGRCIYFLWRSFLQKWREEGTLLYGKVALYWNNLPIIDITCAAPFLGDLWLSVA